MNFILPWVATFGFGVIVFLVGIFLQRSEKKGRLKKKAALEAAKAQTRWESQVTFEGIQLSGFLASVGDPENIPRKQVAQESNVGLIQ